MWSSDYCSRTQQLHRTINLSRPWSSKGQLFSLIRVHKRFLRVEHFQKVRNSTEGPQHHMLLHKYGEVKVKEGTQMHSEVKKALIGTRQELK